MLYALLEDFKTYLVHEKLPEYSLVRPINKTVQESKELNLIKKVLHYQVLFYNSNLSLIEDYLDKNLND